MFRKWGLLVSCVEFGGLADVGGLGSGCGESLERLLPSVSSHESPCLIAK